MDLNSAEILWTELKTAVHMYKPKTLLMVQL